METSIQNPAKWAKWWNGWARSGGITQIWKQASKIQPNEQNGGMVGQEMDTNLETSIQNSAKWQNVKTISRFLGHGINFVSLKFCLPLTAKPSPLIQLAPGDLRPLFYTPDIYPKTKLLMRTTFPIETKLP